MADFAVMVQPIFISPHPNADKLEIGNIGSKDGFQVVVQKGLYQTGDLVAYIGENAVVPDYILQKYNFWNHEKNVGMLAGSRGNRVKAVTLRGVFSLGIVLPTVDRTENQSEQTTPVIEGHAVNDGMDVANILGVTKYEPPIPIHMMGEVVNVAGHTLSFDIENWRLYPDVLIEGEEVSFTEKLHGTFCCVGYWPNLNNSELLYNDFIVTTKNRGNKGLAFKDNKNNIGNVYLNTVKGLGPTFIDNMKTLYIPLNVHKDTPVYVLGEIFGPIQDLQYGFKVPTYRIFDIYVGKPGQGRYVDPDELVTLVDYLGLQTVPRLYTGPFSIEVMKQYTDGMDTLSNSHIREGIVMKPTHDRSDYKLGRVVLKSVSQQYLLRKGKNITDFQ